jgi:Flp pilus assembly pilin Flp
MLSKLWKDEAGFVVSAELIFIATLLVIGLVTGWVAVRGAVTSELTEVAQAISAIDQTYSYTGLTNCSSSTNGTNVTDTYGSVKSGLLAATAVGINVDICSRAVAP